MSMNKYKPNFKDPRVKARIKKAVGFTCAVMGDKPHEWSTRYIDKYLGRQETDLGKWLRRYLIVNVSDRYSKDTHECKQYIINRDGVRYVLNILQNNVCDSFVEWQYSYRQKMCEIIEGDVDEVDESESLVINTNPPLLSPSVQQVATNQVAIQWATEEFADELATLEFKYEDKSYRLWHHLQNVKKECRSIVLANAGLKHQYDIQCCAPTLIHQYAQKCDMDLYLFALRKYLNNRKQVRQEIADYVGIHVDTAKEIVNALFAGARIANSDDTAIYKMLSGNIKQINKLKEMQYITDLRADIKICWEYIKPFTYHDTIVDKAGRTRKLPMSSKQKWNIYFQQERVVLDCVNRYLRESNRKCFLEHDGWTCNELDVEELREYILENTGYKIQIDEVGFINNTPLLSPSVLQVATI